MKPTVSVIMPAYNEGWCIFENIRMTLQILTEADMRAEIVAVDDGSSDHTLAEIERASVEFGNVVAARNPYNMGKGMALRTGFEHSTGDIVVFLDADLDLHPSQITRLINTLEDGPCDIVVGSKHHPESKLDYPLFRTVASWIYYMLIKTLFGLPVRDTQTGLKVFRRRVLDDAFHRILVKKFAYDVELLAVAVRLRYRVREIPVVIDFKRALKWGRIKFSDVLSLFVDTLAIFYRLQMLRYYDTARPPLTGERFDVLVVAFGCPPPEDVVRRLMFDTTHTVRIACLMEKSAPGSMHESIHGFSTEEELSAWISREAGAVDFIGFLGPGCLPLGSWVKSAVREFGDPEVDAVCGPVISGPFSGDSERTAAMVFSSSLTRGTDTRLYSYKPVKTVRKGLAGNLFIRAIRFGGSRLTDRGLVREGEFIHETGSSRGHLRYDPDMAVSRKIPPLTLPYLRTVWQRAFADGFRTIRRTGPGNPLVAGIPACIVALLAFGWIFLPIGLYTALVFLYVTAALVDGFSYFSIKLALPVAAGIFAEHLVRAVAFPSGIAAGIFYSKEKK